MVLQEEMACLVLLGCLGSQGEMGDRDGMEVKESQEMQCLFMYLMWTMHMEAEYWNTAPHCINLISFPLRFVLPVAKMMMVGKPGNAMFIHVSDVDDAYGSRVLEYGSTLYQPHLLSFEIRAASREDDDGVWEPGEEFEICNIEVQNIGELTVPARTLLSIVPSDQVRMISDPVELPLIPPGQRVVIRGGLFGEFVCPPAQRASEITFLKPHSCAVDVCVAPSLHHIPFENCALKETIQVAYPIGLSYVDCPKSIEVGETAKLRFGIVNRSLLPSGSYVVRTGAGAIEYQFESYSPSLECKGDGAGEIEIIRANDTIEIVIEVTGVFLKVAALLSEVRWSLNLFYGGRLIEKCSYPNYAIRISPSMDFLRSEWKAEEQDPQILFIFDSMIQRDNFIPLVEIFRTLEMRVFYWDVLAHHGHLPGEDVFEWFRDKKVVLAIESKEILNSEGMNVLEVFFRHNDPYTSITVPKDFPVKKFLNHVAMTCGQVVNDESIFRLSKPSIATKDMFMHHYGAWCDACEKKESSTMGRMHVVTRYASDAVQTPKGAKRRFWHPVGHDIRVLPFQKRHGMLKTVSLGDCLKTLSAVVVIDQPVALRRSRPVFCITGKLFGRKESKSDDSKSNPKLPVEKKSKSSSKKKRGEESKEEKESSPSVKPSAPPSPVAENESSSPVIYPKSPEMKDKDGYYEGNALGEWLLVILDLFSPAERLEMALHAARDVVVNVDTRSVRGTFNLGHDVVPFDIAHVMIAGLAGDFDRSFKETGSLHWMQTIVDFVIARCYVQEQERIDLLWMVHVVMIYFLETHKSAMKHSLVEEWENAIFAFDSCFDFPSQSQWTGDLDMRTRLLIQSIEYITFRSSSVLDAEGSWNLVPGASSSVKN
eukprot:TRINITY_DN1794_c0_g1_i1.p1 TRINITY_DN1794_c0_g1~~TRINITY_DN1794_c0_g1_i1.p1  ORF type:complete len:878 (-),score=234.42 TRINITY_DN1794_c0_g1_i1:75-2708(-)